MSSIKAVGVDLGGTYIKSALVEPDGTIIRKSRERTLSSQERDTVVRQILSNIETVLGTDTATAIGLAVPGSVDMSKGKVLFMPNLYGDWTDVPLVETISRRFAIPVHLINDTRAAAFGESRYGVGRNARSLVFVSVGTGIGGGIVLDGRLYLGEEDSAGEIGHQTIDIYGSICGCGNWGCVESVASGPAIASLAVKAVKQGHRTVIREMVDGDLNAIDPHIVAKAAEMGDEIAVRILQEAGHYVGTAVANLIVILNPGMIVIGGGVAECGPAFIGAIEDTVAKRVHMVRGGRGNVRIVRSHLGDLAGVLGSAAWALDMESKCLK